jgi:hypothetical protein
MTHQICKRRLFPLGRGIALCALLALAGAAYAQTSILNATANSNLTAITIKGTGLQPVSGSPLVSLGGQHTNRRDSARKPNARQLRPRRDRERRSKFRSDDWR